MHAGADVDYKRLNNEPIGLPWSTQGFIVFPNTPVLAAGPGKVTISKKIGTGGYVQIDHGGGIKTQYMHLTDLRKKVGDSVTGGTRLGTVGWDISPGAYTFAHLHFEVIFDGEKVDPEPILRQLKILQYNDPTKMLLAGLGIGLVGYFALTYKGTIPIIDL